MNRLLVLVLALLAALSGTVSKSAAAEPAAPSTFTLTLIKAGTGDGTTTPPSAPAPGVGHVFPAGAPLRLVAEAAPGSVFDAWSGDLPADFNAREPLLVMNMDRNRTVTATFMPVQCTLTVRVEGSSGPVNVTPAPGTHGCLSGQPVYLNALPADGSPASFVAWSGEVTSGNFAAKVVMVGNKTVTATFTDNPEASRKLVVNLPQGTGAGTCFPLGPGSYRIAANSTLTLGANPNPGSYFGGWMADYAGVNAPQELKVIMDRDRSIGAAFSNTGSTVTVILEGQGDLFPRPGSYALATGLQVPFSAQRVDREWHFDRWQDGDDKVLSEKSAFTYMVNGTAPSTIKGVFVKGKKPSETIARALFLHPSPFTSHP